MTDCEVTTAVIGTKYSQIVAGTVVKTFSNMHTVYQTHYGVSINVQHPLVGGL